MLLRAEAEGEVQYKVSQVIHKLHAVIPAAGSTLKRSLTTGPGLSIEEVTAELLQGIIALKDVCISQTQKSEGEHIWTWKEPQN